MKTQSVAGSPSILIPVYDNGFKPRKCGGCLLVQTFTDNLWLNCQDLANRLPENLEEKNNAAPWSSAVQHLYLYLYLCVFLCHMLNVCLMVWSLGVLNITLESIYRFFIAPLGCKLLPRRAFIMNNSIVHAYFLKTLPHGLQYPC